jgi:hypothetical protein
MKRKFRIPVTWALAYDYVVEAESEQDAIDQVDNMDLPKDGDAEYVDGSFEVNHDCIQEVTPIFVFGSNLAGIHGLGAARTAHEKFGAIMGQGVGLMGSSYGIPTKDKELKVLPLDKIKKHIDTFITFAKSQPYLEFYVTKVGCGLAGYTEDEMAPLFEGCPKNCELRFFKEEELL